MIKVQYPSEKGDNSYVRWITPCIYRFIHVFLYEIVELERNAICEHFVPLGFMLVRNWMCKILVYATLINYWF